MAIPRLNDDMDVIAKLADRPNDTQGLTAAQLKARFDKSGVDIKSYINDTLLPYLESGAAASNMGIEEITGLDAETVQAALEALAAESATLSCSVSGSTITISDLTPFETAAELVQSDANIVLETDIGKYRLPLVKKTGVSPSASLLFVGTSRNFGYGYLIVASFFVPYGSTATSISGTYSEIRIPKPSDFTPQMDGVGDAGSSVDFARADHVHPSDTSKANVEDVPTKTSDLTNDSGFVTAEVFWATYGTTTKAEIETALANNLFVCCKYNSTVYFLSDRFVQGASIFTYTFVGMTTTDGLYIGPQIKYLRLVYKTVDGGTNTWSNGTRIVPDLATDTPSALGTAAVGTSKLVARSDHVHSMPTASDIGAIADPGSGTTGQVLKKTANGTEWANESGGGTTEIFIATYGTTTNAQIETAYSAGKMVFAADSSDNVATLEEIVTGEDFALFTFYHNGYMAVWQCENDTWTSSSKLIPSAYTSSPEMDGTASAGSSSSYAKGDHVHPSDTSRMTAAQVSAAINQALQILSPEDIGAAPAVEVVVITGDGAVTQALNPNVIYEFSGTLTALTITLAAATAPAHYHFRFDSGSTAVSLTLPNTVTMPSGFQVEANKHYEIDILDGYGAAQSW